MLSSVRLRLVLLALLPLLVVMPLLIALVVYWGNAAYDRLHIYKINADLVIAHEYLDKVMSAMRLQVESNAASARLAAALPRQTLLHGLLEDLAREAGFDFLHLLDRSGAVLAGSGDLHPGERLSHWPVVAAAMTGRSGAALDVFEAAELGAVAENLRTRAVLRILPTENAAPDARTEETRGMVIHVAAPVRDAQGRLAAVLEGGVLLNNNLEFVDRINDIVYTEPSLPLGSKGTATLFLGDVRIATNVRLFGGERALGTRVSQAVREQVLGEGKTWLDRAFVVNDWYISGYEPLADSYGRRIGMLYVGYLEEPFAQVKKQILAAMIGLFAVITLAGSALSLAWARQVFEPIEKMDAAMDALERGDARARVGVVDGRDEVARLAQHFDRLLDTLESRNAELRELNAELDRKVIARTEALSRANEELRQAQQHLVRSEKLAAIGQLTAGTAHEINNPIAVMQGNLDLLRAELGEAAAPVATEIRLLDEQINRVRIIVTKLLQFARPHEFAGYVESVDVNAVVADALVLVRHELKKGDVALRLDAAASRAVRINRIELQQVLINLLVNAIQAMPEGGSLAVATEDWDDQGARIRVRDTGQGIAAENLVRVFDPFFTTKKTQGTGLGLSVSLSLVERYGGTISVDSEPGRGAEFTVWLLAEPRFAQLDGAGAEADAPASTHRDS